MSVYTELSFFEIESILCHYSIGELVDYEPIQAGIENTNYFVYTEPEDLESDDHHDEPNPEHEQKWVLTLVEFYDERVTRFTTQLTDHLRRAGLPVAAPIARDDGDLFAMVEGKPCMLVLCFEGKHLMVPSIDNCAEIGEFLAKFHNATESLESNYQRRDSDDWSEQLESIADELTEQQSELAHQVITDFEKIKALDLRTTAIHGDLFIDNALFHNDSLSGVIDFFHATFDYCLYDLAVTVNDWCRNNQGLDIEKLEALLNAYQKIRPLNDDERKAWPVFLMASALHFWFSRILTRRWQEAQGAENVTTKNPAERYELLQWLVKNKEIVNLHACI